MYKGEPLDAERGPGLGCFWIQVGLVAFFLVFTPLTVVWAWDSRISAVLLILTLILLLFTGQTIIFLLRLVAADRRTRRTPLDPQARRTVGQLEDQAVERAPGSERGDEAERDTLSPSSGTTPEPKRPGPGMSASPTTGAGATEPDRTEHDRA
jgi:hypothetical protein